MSLLSPKLAKWGAVGSVVAIIILTVLEFPPPIGFETRPQTNVSSLWLVLFLAIVISEIVAAAIIFKQPKLGARFAIVAGSLNIVQIIADQLHLMQPEVAPLGYTMLELAVGVFSLALIYLAINIMNGENNETQR